MRSQTHKPARGGVPRKPNRGKRPEPAPPAKGLPKVRATFNLPAELMDEARDAVVHLSGPPERLTLADLAANALRLELERLRRAHNAGEPFPPRSGEVRTGRPIRK